jgi:diguanylate cyclase (GGDEF)-like protein
MLKALHDRLDRCSSLPTLPSVALRILDLCQQDQLDLSQIAAVIGRDPALATKLLRTANSPMFALRREATSIMHAVNLLGVSAVRTMVLSFSLAGSCGTGGRPALASYWRRSMLSALAAREIARTSRPPDGDPVNAEEAFLASLLQDIGMLALSRALGKEYDNLLESAGPGHDKLIEAERSQLHADHAEIGAWLLRRWKVPERLAQVVGASHVPDQADSDSAALTGIVAISGRFADLWADDCAAAATRLHEAISRWPGAAIDTAAISGYLVAQGPQLAPMFDVRLDAAAMAEILEQAQEVQVALSMRAAIEVQSIHETLARLESRTAALLAEAQRDPLTGVANRGYTDSYLQEVFPAAVETSRRIGIIFADVDRFKSINDTHGHAAGDAVLRSVAGELTRCLRAGDFVGRYGGEEFVIILRAESIDEVVTAAERIRKSISQRPHSAGPGNCIPVTISLGCALLDPERHRDPAELVADADAALYAAKRNGRDRVEAGPVHAGLRRQG